MTSENTWAPPPVAKKTEENTHRSGSVSWADARRWRGPASSGEGSSGVQERARSDGDGTRAHDGRGRQLTR